MNMDNLQNLHLPPVYTRNNKKCYLDPIRKKLIYITPEETIRQKMIIYLIEKLNVPMDMLIVEQNLSHYGIKSRKRADIVIHKLENNQMLPIAVVECKAPNVYLDDKARDQMLEYCDLIGADYAMLVNDNSQMCFHYEERYNNYTAIDEFPEYKKMLKGFFTEYDPGELPPRIPFDKLESFLQEQFDSIEDPQFSEDISKLTPMNIAMPVFNFFEGLLDTRVKMPTGDYGLFKLIEDYGVRMLTYGNASGGQFYGPYRSFLVDVDGNTEFYSISVSTYCRYSNPQDLKTCINVAHDNEKEAHHSLQLVVDENLAVLGNKISFYHHGKITIGRFGSGKINELRNLIAERYPKIIAGKKFYLGAIDNDRLWRLDDPEVIQLVVNLISYAIVRDEYRDYVKQKKQK